MQTLFLQWLDDRTGLPSLYRKIRHRKSRSEAVSKSAGVLRFLPTMILFAFLLQALSGVLLWTFYSPTPQTAWESLFYLQFGLPGGWMVRGIHHFSAQLLIVLLGVYLLTQVLGGGYRSPREFVFWTAFLLFLCALAASHTGALLAWTHSGFSATLIRLRFLPMLPGLGEPLRRIMLGGAEPGVLTLPRFLVAHILIFGGGFFLLAILWPIFDRRSKTLIETESESEEPIRSGEALRHSLACLALMLVLLICVYRQPLLHALRPDLFPMTTHLPVEATLGVAIDAPADPANFYDAARPDWPFRGLYHLAHLEKADGSEIFPGEKKFLPIFVIPGCLVLYALLIPPIGRLKIGHVFNVVFLLFLVVAGGYLTVASYRQDKYGPEMADFRQARRQAGRLAERAVELGLNPEGIPPSGALTALHRDPLLQGPVLYERHCAMCHPFSQPAGGREHPDFEPLFHNETVRAPNLYHPIRRDRIEGFLSARRLQSDDYFGRTKFAGGTMVQYLRDRMKEILLADEANEDLFEELVSLLHEEAQRDGPRIVTPSEVEGLEHERLIPLQTFGCGQCHMTYISSPKPAIQAPDLRGYLSRDWMIGMVADPETSRFYGPPLGTDKGNDGMPAFHRSAGEATMTWQEIETLVDWLRGRWFRFEKQIAAMEHAPLETIVPEESAEPTEP